MSKQSSNQLMIQNYIDEAKQLREQGKPDKALEKNLSILQINSNSIPALNQLTQIYEERKEFD